MQITEAEQNDIDILRVHLQNTLEFSAVENLLSAQEYGPGDNPFGHSYQNKNLQIALGEMSNRIWALVIRTKHSNESLNLVDEGKYLG